LQAAAARWDLERSGVIAAQRDRINRLAWWLFCACAWAVVATALALRGC
jgi:type VI protein secretion system component VasF